MSAAAASPNCAHEDKRCVDGNGAVTNPANCRNGGAGSGGAFHWYSGASNAAAPTGHARPDWQRIVERQGLVYHTPEGIPYRDESVCYIIDRNRFAQFGISSSTSSTKS